MSEFAYASVGVNLQEFMNGKNPTTQPGVRVAYYTSMAAALENMEFEFDGENSTSCLMMFDVDAVKTKLESSPNSNILGRGTITPQHIVDAMIQINQPDKEHPLFVDAGKCDWNKARETIQFTQERQHVPEVQAPTQPLVAYALRWDDQARFAAEMECSYIDDFISDTHIFMSEEEMDRLQGIFWNAYSQDQTVPEAQKIIAGLDALEDIFIDYRQNIAPVPSGTEFYERAAFRRLYSDEIISDIETEHIAAANFAILPDKLRDVATEIFAARLLAKDCSVDGMNYYSDVVASALAYTWRNMIDKIPMGTTFAADALRYAAHAMQQEEQLGVPASETGIAGGDEPDVDEPDEEI